MESGKSVISDKENSANLLSMHPSMWPLGGKGFLKESKTPICQIKEKYIPCTNTAKLLCNKGLLVGLDGLIMKHCIAWNKLSAW